jgi:hypothetical protein
MLSHPFYRVVDWLAGYRLIEDQPGNIIGYMKPNKRGARNELFRVYTSPYKQPRREVIRAAMDFQDPWKHILIKDPENNVTIGSFRKEKKALRSIFADNQWKITKKGQGHIGYLVQGQGAQIVDLFQQPCGQFVRGQGRPTRTFEGWWQNQDPRYDRRFLLASMVIQGVFEDAREEERRRQQSSGGGGGGE